MLPARALRFWNILSNVGPCFCPNSALLGLFSHDDSDSPVRPLISRDRRRRLRRKRGRKSAFNCPVFPHYITHFHGSTPPLHSRHRRHSQGLFHHRHSIVVAVTTKAVTPYSSLSVRCAPAAARYCRNVKKDGT